MSEENISSGIAQYFKDEASRRATKPVKPVLPPELPANATEQQRAARAFAVDTAMDAYRQQLLDAAPGLLDADDRKELARMIGQGISRMRASGEVQ